MWQEENRSLRLPLPKNTVWPVTCWFCRTKNSRSLILLSAFLPSTSGYEWRKVDSLRGKYTIQVSKSDAGSYQCRADNGIERHIQSDFELEVSGTRTLHTLCRVLVLPAKGSVLSCQSKWGAFERFRHWIECNQASLPRVPLNYGSFTFSTFTLPFDCKFRGSLWVFAIVVGPFTDALTSSASDFFAGTSHLDDDGEENFHSMHRRRRDTTFQIRVV